ncbi:hypothetical protein SAMN05216367_2745 [Tardiphaga sp. OK245]|nr:hypothetical protein SAMN05216367_2745 [Tardiphaga sp. OK245]
MSSPIGISRITSPIPPYSHSLTSILRAGPETPNIPPNSKTL